MAEGSTHDPVNAPRKSWFPEFLLLGEKRIRGQVRLLGLSVLVGLVAGLAAVTFYVATQAVSSYTLGTLAGYRPEPHPAGEPVLPWLPAAASQLSPWLLIVIPTIGGLLSGLLVYTFAPEAEGHGTDSVIAAYHLHQGFMRPRVPLIKLLASTLTLGSGGSGGREGPIAQIGAGFGSVLADFLRLRPVDRRVLLAAGMGAGIAAIFRAPLAGALFAAEVLYRTPEFEPEVILPAALASVIAYCTFGAVFGWEPLFAIPSVRFTNPWQLVPFGLLAIFMALLAALYTRTFYGLTALFHKLPVPRHIKPAIGALLTGLIGVSLYYAFGRQERVLSVMAFGYGAIQGALTEHDSAGIALLLAIALGKILTTSLTIGSGGSGGVFGPSMVIGACGGGAFGMTLAKVWPELVQHPSSFAIVGMAGFFAAAAKTPFSTLIIVSEMTGGYQLLLPALWVCTIAFMLSDEQSIYSAQVAGRSRSPAHQGAFVREILAGFQVRQFMSRDDTPVAVRPQDSLADILDRFDSQTNFVLPVVGDENCLSGVVNLEEVFLAAHTPELRRLVVAADLMRNDITPLTPDDSLQTASELFVENDLPALPVVDNLLQRRFIGLLKRGEVAAAYLRLTHGVKVPQTDPLWRG